MRLSLALAATLVISLVNSSAFGGPTWPKPDFNSSCDFYRGAENILKCQNSGSDYLLSYGYHYCSRFREANQRWTGKLKTWVANTGQCLQEMLYDNRAKRLDTCEHLEEFAFDSHPVCYKQYGFCDLDSEDYLRLMDFLRASDLTVVEQNFRRSQLQMLNVYAACADKFGHRVEDTLFHIFSDQFKNFSPAMKPLAAQIFMDAPKKEDLRNKYFFSALAITLFGVSDDVANSAAALYHKQFTNVVADNSVKALQKTQECVSSLLSGGTPAGCHPEVITDFFSNGLSGKMKAPKPAVSEDKLQQIIRLNSQTP